MNKPLVAALLLGTGIVLGLALALTAPDAQQHQEIEWLDNPRDLNEFILQMDTGAFDNQSLLGHWTVVLFGFLHCPDICPTSLSEMATLADSMSERRSDRKTKYLFVSVDPGRDSASEVSQYARHFNAVFVGVTGDQDQLTQLTSSLGVQFKVTDDSNNYTVSHSITFSIIDPEGVFRGRFRPGFDKGTLAWKLASIQNTRGEES